VGETRSAEHLAADARWRGGYCRPACGFRKVPLAALPEVAGVKYRESVERQ
jgi:hypothetical protein